MSVPALPLTYALAKPRLVIDEALYPRLLALAEKARARMPALAERLLEEIERADLRPSHDMPGDVVTLGSEVDFRDEERIQSVRIVTPAEADIDRRRVSVIAPVGAALLGLAAGQSIAWEMPNGRVKVLEVIAVRPPSAGALAAPH
jgi:regulator of nucleoside diphosphate kinase